MTEYTKPPVEEPDGYNSRPGYVKSRPENNQHYVDQYADDPWFEIISRCAAELEEVIPGYNIAQIKAKFGGLRFYIGKGSVSDEVWEQNINRAYAILYAAEKAVDEL